MCRVTRVVDVFKKSTDWSMTFSTLNMSYLLVELELLSMYTRQAGSSSGACLHHNVFPIFIKALSEAETKQKKSA